MKERSIQSVGAIKCKIKEAMSMNEKQLLKICIAVAVIGIGGLFILSKTAAETNIQDITEEDIDKKLVISGVVDNLQVRETMTLFTIKNMPVVFFEALDIQEGNTVKITGTVKEYKGKLEIVGEKVGYN
jgi:DNA/RNA endonuclease YhcR with UshA esterase domain